ncbi:MAG: hypothetical protein M9921_00720 [Fimbriimonadaceae bacterium]|nr:hypothetical protein [Chthonomonadaceae bacterium]MCO5295357.1 hypothetical protein [Fimbriimonadaceae bacterium]
MDSFSNLTQLSLLDVLLWPVAAAILGALIWILGNRYEEDDGSPLVKWIAVAPVGFALVKGFSLVLRVMGNSVDAVIYRDAIGGRKMLFAHYAAFVIPLLVAIGIAAWFTVRRNQDRI